MIVLISCVSKKLQSQAQAQDLYTSPLFKLNLKYARQLNADRIYILSAEHGLLKLTDEIEPYEKTLNTMKAEELKAWSSNVLKQIEQEGLSLEKDNFTFLAGEKYRKYIAKEMKNYSVPMQNLGIGYQLQKLKQLTTTQISLFTNL